MTISNQLPSAEPDLLPESAAAISPPTTHTISFTGSGSEYFRIWIVNLCLTMATLGIYSAWAKVRRLQYFDRNTQLDGASFNFHGRPLAILKGRLIALVLLICYHYAFGFSKLFGMTVITILFLALPAMLRSALRFRLKNTSYRGVRFDFAGDLIGAYTCFAPLLAVLLMPAILVGVFPGRPILLVVVCVGLYLSWPVIHAMIKRYQHTGLEYGDQKTTYRASNFSLIKPYALAFLAGIGVVIVISILSGLFFAGVAAATQAGAAADSWTYGVGILIGVLYVYAAFLISGPFLQIRIWNLVWNNTSFPGFTIQSTLKFWPFLELQTVNIVLTLLTLGLYRPFAVVRIYRYRMQHMTVTGDGFAQIGQGQHSQYSAASGDSSADFLDIDLSF
ncbi:uncharacterized membrane protein YjgN (DUF898 family) [Oxalobacteraceae bacterium GrIS 2.11]